MSKDTITPSLRDGVLDDGLVCHFGLLGTTPKGKSIVAQNIVKHPMVSQLGTRNIYPRKLFVPHTTKKTQIRHGLGNQGCV